MTVIAMYRDFREQFPRLSGKADARHIKVWDSINDETAFCWFESLAGAINDQLATGPQTAELTSVFSYFAGQYSTGDDDVKRCIDASFVENLFWEVPKGSAITAWALLPKPMQQLYINFHGHAPDLK